MVSKIAIFRALHLGDMLCIIPSVRAIRMKYTDAEIFLIGLPWQKDLLARFHRYFDHFIEFPGWPGLPEQDVDVDKILVFLKKIRGHRFDLVFQMQGNGEITNSMCMLWGAKKVFGLRRTGEYAPRCEDFPVSEDNEHEVLRFLKLLECDKIPRQGTDLEFPVTNEEDSLALRILWQNNLTSGSFICLHAGARDERRRWHLDNFAFVANSLASRGHRIILTGSQQESALLRELQLKIHTPVLNIVEAVGHLTIGELGAVMRHSQLLISNDTGVSHIAAALRLPSVIIFSQHSDIRRWRPLENSTHIAIPFDRSSDPQFVLENALEMLDRHKQKIVRQRQPNAKV
jgi:ADP-heptose:LPS heptosyltransferase